MTATDIQTYTLKPSGAAPIRFEGEVLATIKTHGERVHPDFSGRDGVAHSMTLYRRNDRKFVLEIYTDTRWQGEHNSRTVTLCDTANEILKALNGISVPVIDNFLEKAGIEYDDYQVRTPPTHQ